MKKIVDFIENEDLWKGFLIGSIVGIFAGITMGFLMFA